MSNMKKSKFQRFLYGVKLGWNLYTLPDSVNIFHNYALVRIFRVIGGISIILFLTSPSWIEDSSLYWIIFTLTPWIMRDGTFNGITLLLCTDSYSIKEVVILMNVLMIRYNIYCNIHSYNNRYPKIYIYIYKTWISWVRQ